MFQQEQVRPSVFLHTCSAFIHPCCVSQPDAKTEKPIPALPDTLWEVEVKTASPVRDAPVKQTIDLLLEVQTIMKGLLDLRRQEF